MESNSIQSSPSNTDEISLHELVIKIKYFFAFLKSKWLNLFFAGIVGALFGLGYYYVQSSKYTAECTFVLDEKSGGGGALASLVPSFGVDVGGMLGGGGNLFAYDNILDIMQSRRIVESVLLSEVDTAITTHQTLADLYLNFTKLKIAYDKKERTAGIHFNGYSSRNQFSPVQDSILYVIYKSVIKNHLVTDRTNKKTQVFKVDITSKNEYFSKLLAERVVTETKNLYIGIKTGTTQKNIDRLQQKADSLLLLLNGKSYESAEAQVLNANPAMKNVLVPTKLATRNETIIGTLYTEVVKNLETAKTTLMLQTPVIQILDNPKLPLENNKSKRSLLIIGGSFFFFLFGLIYQSFRYFIIAKLNNE
jgi:hypothetical protein